MRIQKFFSGGGEGGGSEGYLCLLGKGERNPRPIFGNIYFVNLKKIKFPEGSKPYPPNPHIDPCMCSVYEIQC